MRNLKKVTVCSFFRSNKLNNGEPAKEKKYSKCKYFPLAFFPTRSLLSASPPGSPQLSVTPPGAVSDADGAVAAAAAAPSSRPSTTSSQLTWEAALERTGRVRNVFIVALLLTSRHR